MAIEDVPVNDLDVLDVVVIASSDDHPVIKEKREADPDAVTTPGEAVDGAMVVAVSRISRELGTKGLASVVGAAG